MTRDAGTEQETRQRVVSLELDRPIWERFFWVSPLAVIGTVEEDGGHDFAPKHMVTPLGWDNWFGFVCTPRHATYRNAVREGVFTVSMPRPEQVVASSLSASPRCDDRAKPALRALPTRPATEVEGAFLAGSYLFLECELERVVDGFGDNSLLAGRIVAAEVAADALRTRERDPQDLIRRAPLLAYLPPTRFARIERSFSFPFPSGFQR